jgi:hypothetical protein
MRTLIFKRGIGNFKQGETHEITNEITADYFVNNDFATEKIVKQDCKECGEVSKTENSKEVKENKKKSK